MNTDADYSHQVDCAGGDRAQARFFRAELSNAVAGLDEQIGDRERALQHYRTRTQADQIRDTERALQHLRADCHRIDQMLAALSTRFPEP